MANYPSLQPVLTNPASTDYLTSPAHASQHADANDEIEAIALELGTNPSGSYGDVKARLDAVDAALAGKISSVAGANGYLLKYQGGVIVDSGYQASDFAPASHTSSPDHDTRYYTEAEITTFLGGKMDLVVGAPLGNFASYDGGGQVENSTYNASSFDSAGTAAAAVAVHAATHTISIEHNPFVVGTKEVDETNIADNKILYYHYESDQIRYGDVVDITQEEIEDYVAGMFIAGTGPTTWTYNDGAGTLRVDLPQAVATTSSVQFGSINVNGAFTLPTVDGANGQVMITNGAGVVSWQNAGAAANVQEASIRHFTYALGGM